MDVSVLRNLLRLEPGDVFDFYRWQSDRDRLLEALRSRGYREARVRADRSESATGGVMLAYEIDAGPLTVLTVSGYALPGSVLDQIGDAWADAIFDEALEEDAVRLARVHLVREGYVAADVQSDMQVTSAINGSLPPEADGSPAPQTSQRKELLLRVNPGQRYRDRTIAFSGHTRITDARLRQLVTDEELSDVAWVDGQRLSDALTALYRGEGLLDAAAAVDPATFEPDRTVLPVHIVEGPIFRLLRVEVEGVLRYPVEDATRAAGLQPGAVFTESTAEDARRRLDAYYRMRGHNSVRVAVRTAIDRGRAEATLTLVVDEGAQQILQEVSVSGAEGTRSSVIENALRFESGTPVDMSEWYRARKRLFQTNLFRRVDLTAEPVTRTPPVGGIQPVRARVVVEEWPRSRLRYGFQLNEERPESESEGTSITPGFVADFTRRNLLGRAATVGLSARVERREQTGRTFLTLPSLFGLPIGSSLFLSRSRTHLGAADETAFIADRTEVTAEQRVPAGAVRVSYSYKFQQNHTFDPLADPDDPFGFDITVNVARLNATAIVDTRDDPFDPTRGWFHSSSVEYASDRVGSDLRFAKYLLQQSYFRPLGRGIVIASALRLGIADAFGQVLIPSERFFAGGGNSVRGYGQDAIGERDVIGDPRGGTSLLVINSEVRFPISGRFRGVTFFDAGSPFARAGEVSLTALRAGVGLGLRVQTPFVLLRVDYGLPVNAREGEHGRWFFSFGQAF